MIDVLIVGADVIDGSGNPAQRRDVAVRAGRIVEVAPRIVAAARRTIRAEGLTVAPGFIDPHSHSDWSVLANREAHSTIRQGVTTEVVGNCGITYAPLTDVNVREASAALAVFGYDEVPNWRSFAELLAVVHETGTAQNLAWLVGHSALRTAAGALGASVDTFQRDQMRRLLADAIAAGALGMSSGLEYGSGRSATTDELLELGTDLGSHRALYASHIRNRDSELGPAINEFVAVARRAGHAQISHLNVRHNTGAAPGAWQHAVEQIEAERKASLAVLADFTPYTSGLGLAMGLLPPWLLESGPEQAAQLLREPQIRDQVREDCDRYWRFVHRGEWSRVRIGVSPGTPQFEGMTMPEIAAATGTDEWEALFDILAAAGPQLPSVQLVGELFTEAHVAEALAHPLFCWGVDGFTSRLDGPLRDRTKHPLFFSGHLHFLAHHVLQHDVLPLPEAIRRMTSMVADHFGLVGRGRIVPGAHADLALLDVETLSALDTRSYTGTYLPGVPFVLVNGEVVIDKGRHTGALAGTLLTRGAG